MGDGNTHAVYGTQSGPRHGRYAFRLRRLSKDYTIAVRSSSAPTVVLRSFSHLRRATNTGPGNNVQQPRIYPP